LAEEGADIIAIDLCEQIPTVPYEMPGASDLEQTAQEVESLDRRIVARQADVRDLAAMESAIDDGVSELGRLDIVAANAGIGTVEAAITLTEQAWQDVIDVDLTGVWHTVKATVPHIRAGGEGGVIVITGSSAGLRGLLGLAHYAAAKHGLIGLARTLASELGPERIRVNTLHPTQVNTPQIQNEHIWKRFVPDKENPTREDFAPVSENMHLLPVPWVEPVDISNAVLFLASDEARYITGVMLPVDAGLNTKA
jgi:SDR family mycofactocin-dependent oxidoreductase